MKYLDTAEHENACLDTHVFKKTIIHALGKQWFWKLKRKGSEKNIKPSLETTD